MLLLKAVFVSKVSETSYRASSSSLELLAFHPLPFADVNERWLNLLVQCMRYTFIRTGLRVSIAICNHNKFLVSWAPGHMAKSVSSQWLL